MDRNIIATLIRKGEPVYSRRYARLDTAISRATQIAILEGKPEDVVVLSHAVTGLELGTMKVSLRKGQVTLETKYVRGEHWTDFAPVQAAVGA